LHFRSNLNGLTEPVHSRMQARQRNTQRQEDEKRRDETRRDVQRTLIGRGLKRSTRLPRLPMEFPASSMFYDSFRRVLQRETRMRVRIGRTKAECFQSSYSM